MKYGSEEFDKFVQEKMNEYKVAGLSVALITSEDIHPKVRESLHQSLGVIKSTSGLWLRLAV